MNAANSLFSNRSHTFRPAVDLELKKWGVYDETNGNGALGLESLKSYMAGKCMGKRILLFIRRLHWFLDDCRRFHTVHIACYACR